MRVLVTGASGFVGSLLVPRLLAEGHLVRALGRDPGRVSEAISSGHRPAPAERLEVLGGDAVSGAGLDRALDEVEVAYYLIHSMERSQTTTRSPIAAFAQRELLAAENFAAASARAGVGRIVYLGGLIPRWGEESQRDSSRSPGRARGSAHLASREQVEGILREGAGESLALRASIVIGARSRSFRLLVRLVERMPVLPLPAWQRYRTQPIDGRDVTEMLLAAATVRLPVSSLDVGGAEVLSYGQLLSRIAELMLVGRPPLQLGVNLTAVTGRLAAAIAGEDPELVLPLMEGLQGDLLPATDDAADLLGVRLHSLDSAVEHALADWERSERLAAR